MSIGILHMHTTVVVLFMVLLLFKSILLFLNKETLLDKVRAKTKIADIVLGVLILVTGGALVAFKGALPAYLLVKIVLVFAGIPLGIIGMKRKKKPLVMISLLCFFYSYGVAESKSYTLKPAQFEVATDQVGDITDRGKIIYDKLCVECHGGAGDKGLYKAADLSISTLTPLQAKDILKHGKGAMMAYDKVLSEEDQDAVIAYIQTLKK